MAATVGELVLRLMVDTKQGAVNVQQLGNQVSKTVSQSRRQVNSLQQAFSRFAALSEKLFFSFQGAKILFTPFEKAAAVADKYENAQRKLNATSKLTGASLESLIQTYASGQPHLSFFDLK